MKKIFVLMICAGVATTFGMIRVYGAEPTQCKNIVPEQVTKVVPCDATKSACPAVAAAKKGSSKTAD